MELETSWAFWRPKTSGLGHFYLLKLNDPKNSVLEGLGLDFGAPSWPYVGTHFALDGIFRHAAGIAAKKPCWHSLSAFRFHYAARRYVRSTWNWNQVGSKLLPYLKALPFFIPLELNVF